MIEGMGASIGEFLRIGGPAMVVLVIMSIFLVTVVIIKIWQFHKGGVFSAQAETLAHALMNDWRNRDFDTAQARLSRLPGASITVLMTAVNTQLSNSQLTGERLVEELVRVSQQQLIRLRQHLRSLEVVANLAPLIGLLGTVLGMINAFKAMELAGKQVDPSVLSGGIWEALLTTAVGLVIAIPATIAYNWFDRRVESCAELMQDTISNVSTLLAIQEVSQPHKSEANVKKIHSASA